MAETPQGHLLVMLMLLPLTAVLLSLVCGGRWARGIVLGALAGGLLVVGAVWRGLRESGDALVYWMGGWSPPLGLALRADGISVVMLATTVLVTGAVAWYAPAKFRVGPDGRETRLSLVFWVLVAGLWTAMNAVSLGNDLFNFYVAVELLTFSAVPLVALDGRARTLAAAIRYLLFALSGSLLYLLGVVLVYGRYGMMDVVMLREVVEWDGTTGLAVALMTAGLAAKSALFPFHLWLPPAHAGAPSPASALLSALAVKGSFLILIRIWFDMMPPLAGAAAAVPAAMGTGAVLLGGVMALRQKRLKMLIAYSTVAQIGYLFLIFPLAFGSAAALPAGMMQVVAHAFAKAAMFLGAGLVVEACGHDRLAGLRGLGGRMPVTVAALGLAGASLIGVPPTGGFAAKWLLVRAAFESGQWLWWLVPAAGGLMAGGYVFRILSPMISRAESAAPLVVKPVAMSREMLVMALALAALALGLFSDEMVGLMEIGRTGSGGGADAMTGLLFITGLVLPALLAVAAFAGLLRGRMMRAALLAAPLPAFLTAVLGSGTGPVHAGDWIFAVDVSGAMLMGAAALLWMAAGIFVSRDVLGNAGFRRFCGCWFLTMTGSLGVFVAADLIGFLTMYALASLPAYGLVTHDGTPPAQRAGAAYLGCSLVGETLLVSGFVLLAMNSPGHSLLIADAVAALPDSPWRDLTLGMLVAGFAMKMGLVPMHFWLPLAHPAAPAAGSAVLSGAIIKAGVIGLVRFLPLVTPMPDWGLALAWAGLVTALYGVVIGMTQSYAKTILAYSSVSQMGVVAAMLGMALAAGDPSVGADAAFYAMHHLFAKGGLFLAVGLVAASGLCRKWLVFVPCALLALGMAGLPFTGGALAKITSKSVLGSGMAATMAGVSAAGTAMLMLHFLWQLKRMERPEKRPAGDLMAAFWGLAVVGMVVRWAVYQGAGFGQFADPFAAKTVVHSLVPIAAGCVAFLILKRVKLPSLPAGDVANCFSRVRGLTGWCGRISARLDFGVRGWSTAAGILVAVVLLIAALIHWRGGAG